MPESLVQRQTKSAVILLSGGLDSATTLALAQDQGFACHCLSFDYAQRHRFELQAAASVASALSAAAHKIAPLDLGVFAGSALTDNVAVPKDRDEAEMNAEIPVTYVPARNLIFLSIAAAYAETINAADIFIGVNAVDYSGYPDCRPEFIAAFEHAANLATKAGVQGTKLTIHTPLIDLPKADIIKLGTRLGVDYALTHSCYDPDKTGAACGRCDSCIIRRNGFADADTPDPTRYTQGTRP